MTSDRKTEISAYIASLTSAPPPMQNSGISDQYSELRQPPPHAARIHAKLNPLVDRLRLKLAELPPEEKEFGLKLSQVWAMCSGVQRSKPPAWAVGAALRELGYVRYRMYSSDSEPSATWWVPPGVDIEEAKRKIRERK